MKRLQDAAYEESLALDQEKVSPEANVVLVCLVRYNARISFLSLTMQAFCMFIGKRFLISGCRCQNELQLSAESSIP